MTQPAEAMTRPPLVPVRGLQSHAFNTKIIIPAMNPKSVPRPLSVNWPSNGGDYVTEGMAGPQQSVAGALTPAA